MKSSVQPTGTPSSYTGIQLVSPCTTRCSSTAISTRTSGSSSSSSPPSVKPISGRPFSETHSSEIARIWSRSASGASWYAHHSAVMPCLPALLSAVRMSCHLRPVKASSGSATTVSSATCTERQPSCAAASLVCPQTL